jgi:hypothetical protein
LALGILGKTSLLCNNHETVPAGESVQALIARCSNVCR